MKNVHILILALFTFLIASSFNHKSASAKMSCDSINGNWSGKMSGVYSGPTTLSIKSNCKIKWKLPDGRTNFCNYKEKSGKTEYSCRLGSRGSVAIKNNTIIMRNIHTAKKHGAYTVRLSKN